MKRMSFNECLNILQETINLKSGKLITPIEEIIGVKSSVTIKCSNPEHPPFTNQAFKVYKNGQWCPYCRGRKGNFPAKYKELIEHRGGAMIGDYVNNHTPIQVKCGKGHLFNPSPANLNKGQWCPYCAGIKGDFVTPLIQYIESKGGKLKSEYKGADTKVTVECLKHGDFKMTPYHLKNRKQWCPECHNWITQEKCHQIIEELTGHKFIKEYRLSCGRRNDHALRLDGYSPELHLAFEYHGIQHYIPQEIFGGNEKFQQTQERDKEKAELCQKLNIKLIVIPYTVKDHKSFIRNQLSNMTIPCQA